MYCKPTNSDREPRGFTLIELLIVAAILAILAAIATPNFLEAQVRAKVSRVRADIKTQETAIASYRVDHNRHPRGPIESQTEIPLPVGDRRWYLWQAGRGALTTPVAYLTALPNDPFFRTTEPFSPPDPDWYEWGEGYPLYVYFTLEDMSLFAEVNYCLDWVAFLRRNNSRWGLVSRGPDMDFVFSTSFGPFDDPNHLYDPTNGSRSGGEIAYFDGCAYDCRFLER